MVSFGHKEKPISAASLGTVIVLVEIEVNLLKLLNDIGFADNAPARHFKQA